jgi:hypothetical protein
MAGSGEVVKALVEVLGAARQEIDNPGLQELALNLLNLVVHVGPHIGAGGVGGGLHEQGGHQQQQEEEEEEEEHGGCEQQGGGDLLRKQGQAQEQQLQGGRGCAMDQQNGVEGPETGLCEKGGQIAHAGGTAAEAAADDIAVAAAVAAAADDISAGFSNQIKELVAAAGPLHGPLLLELLHWLNPDVMYPRPHLRLVAAAAAAWQAVTKGLRERGGKQGLQVLVGLWMDPGSGLAAAAERLLNVDMGDAEEAVERELDGELGYAGLHVAGRGTGGIVAGRNLTGGLTGVQRELLVLWRQVTAVAAGVRLLNGVLQLHVEQLVTQEAGAQQGEEQEQGREEGQQEGQSVVSVLGERPWVVRRMVAIALGKWPAAAAGGGDDGVGLSQLHGGGNATADNSSSSSNSVLHSTGVHRAIAGIETRHPLWGYLVEELHQLVIGGLRGCRSLGASCALGTGLLMRHEEELLGALVEGVASSRAQMGREGQVFEELYGVLQALQARGS